MTNELLTETALGWALESLTESKELEGASRRALTEIVE
jgi:hypothetical protein